MSIQRTSQDQARVSQIINAMQFPLEILEAGCGRKWLLNISVPYRLTGVDTDSEAMRARIHEMHDLDTAIVGDIRTVDLPANSYDVIYCCWVLEHVDGAEIALKNFARWLKPGGVIIVRVPDRDSLFGWLTRITPFAFHVWFYRVVYGFKWAGTEGHGPYPTFYDHVISWQGMKSFCSAHGLRLEEVHKVDSWIKGRKARMILASLLAVVTGFAFPWRWNNLTFIIHKP